MPSQPSAALCARPATRDPLTDDSLIRVQAMAVRAICSQLTAGQLEVLRRNVEKACLMPEGIGWDRQATAHAEIFALLADAADHPVLAQTLNSGVGLVHHLMVNAGPTANAITVNSRKRLLGQERHGRMMISGPRSDRGRHSR